MIRVAVDAMGGDYAPVEMVKGAVDAVAKTDQIDQNGTMNRLPRFIVSSLSARPRLAASSIKAGG